MSEQMDKVTIDLRGTLSVVANDDDNTCGFVLHSELPAPAQSDSNDEFRIQVYSEKWDAIREKEHRLWAFMSFYGAAIGLAVGTGRFEDPVSDVVILTLLLTAWGVCIIINNDWWSHRNRLIASRIERQFEAAVTGVIPFKYLKPRFRLDRLYRVSAGALFLIATFIVGVSTYKVFLDLPFESVETATRFLAVHVLYAVGFVIAIIRLEWNLRQYYKTWDELDNDEKKTPDVASTDSILREELKGVSLTEGEKKDRQHLTWRIWAVATITASHVCLQMCFFSPVACFSCITAMVLQGLALLLFVILMCCYYLSAASAENNERHLLRCWHRDDDEKIKPHLTQIGIAVLYGISVICLLCSLKGRGLDWMKTDMTSAALARKAEDLKREVGRLQQDAAIIEQLVREKQLADYLKTEDARSQYATVSDLDATKGAVTKIVAPTGMIEELKSRITALETANVDRSDKGKDGRE